MCCCTYHQFYMCLLSRTYDAHSCPRARANDRVAILCPVCGVTLSAFATVDADRLVRVSLLNVIKTKTRFVSTWKVENALVNQHHLHNNALLLDVENL